MFIYSKNIILFVNEVKSVIKNVLSREVGLTVSRDRFYDRHQTTSYPIKVVIYNHKSILGYFDSDFYELGLHERLMHAKKEQLHAIIRHELAHYMTFIHHGAVQHSHGPEFKAFCQKMGWGDEISKASICLEESDTNPQSEESAILRKVQKLMALGGSANMHEAELAVIKARELLVRHHLEAKYLDEINNEKMILKRILKQKKIDAKMRCIGNILQTFFVSVVYSRGGTHSYLEILGDSVNVEIAEYVALFLQREVENLWHQAEKQQGLRGLIAKNSFFYGMAKGYCDKVLALKKASTQEMASALIVLEKKLTEQKEIVYPRLTSFKSQGQYCPNSASLGEHMGRHLNINPAVHQKANNSERLLN
jgi:hypothetical protein